MEKVKLGDVATYINGYAFKPTDWSHEGVLIIRIQDLTGNSYQANRYNGNYEKKYEIQKGDVLISWSASLGVYVWQGETAVLNQHIFKVVFDKVEIDKNFFVHQVECILKNASSEAHGATMKHLTKPVFDALPFYLPSLEEQKAIAERLDKVSGLIEKRKTQLKKLDLLIKSRFIEMFGNPVSNDKDWQHQAMDKVAPSSAGLGDNSETVWLLNLDMVEAQTGRILDYLYVEKAQVGASTCAFDEGNVLYSKLRPYLNKVVVPTKKGYCTTELVPLRPNEKLNRQFFAYLLQSEAFVSFINEKVAGAKMPRVSMSVFRDFECILPPIVLQNEFATFVEQVEKSKFRIQKSLEKLEILKKSLMQKYFQS